MADTLTGKKIALYARVSTDEQTCENQIDRLRKWATNNEVVPTEFVEVESTRNTRPEKEKVLKLLRTRQVHGVAVVALDRWGRSASELVVELEEFQKRGIIFVALDQGIDLSTIAGTFTAQLLAAFAQMERSILRERTLNGLARALREGKILGRHPVNCGCGKNIRGRPHTGYMIPIIDPATGKQKWFDRRVGGENQTSPENAPIVPDRTVSPIEGVYQTSP